MIEILNLNKSFGEKTIFSDFSLSLPDRGLFILSGNSGRGKTTLLRIIAGLDRDYTGEVKVSAERISMAFQEDRLINTLTASENVELVCNDRNKSVELLKELGLEKEIDRKPGELSGGMKRRVAFARAMAYSADIYLLDEPTASLDKETATIILSMMNDKARTSLVLAVLHDLSEIDSSGGKIINI